MLKKAVNLALLIAVTSTAVSAEELSGTLKKIKDSGIVTIGFRDSSLPFSYLDENQKPVGYAVDICVKVVDELKEKLQTPQLQIKFNPVTSASRIPLIANGTVDMECGSTFNTLERQNQVAFANTYFLTANRFVSKKSSNLNTIADLAGQTVVSTSGTANIQELSRTNVSRNLGIKIVAANDHAEAFLMLDTGRASAFVMDDILLASLVAGSRKPSEYSISSEAFSAPQPYAIMIRRGDQQFKNFVNEATAKLFQSAQMQQIYNKWFNEPIPPRGLNLSVPLSPALAKAFKTPSDSADSATYLP
ncbi:amino acid ABC transporter substrate-binding protein [Pseudomonas corrugata]|uniref:amino acid ABC transporter substrate-binding protein n=1 Tax=Pseudomonas TaxID=286 RepID=UPI0024318125|nr:MULTISPECIES: amino acid ABC transporter substrate-binding protein [Pseudomonas]MEC4242290.1 amino acid ABC transporter substrate-binding protein [Pseudomonas sp. DSV-1]